MCVLPNCFFQTNNLEYIRDSNNWNSFCSLNKKNSNEKELFNPFGGSFNIDFLQQ